MKLSSAMKRGCFCIEQPEIIASIPLSIARFINDAKVDRQWLGTAYATIKRISNMC